MSHSKSTSKCSREGEADNIWARRPDLCLHGIAEFHSEAFVSDQGRHVPLQSLEMSWVKVLAPFAPEVKTSNGEQSDHTCLLLDFFSKRKKKELSMKATQRRGRAAEHGLGKLLLSITHAPLSAPFTPPAANWLHSPPLSLCLADNCVIWPYRGI